MNVIQPPHKIISNNYSVFLGGSINMGNSVNWQNKIIESFSDDITFFNPRRDQWDLKGDCVISNELFREQVEWELDHLTKADLIVLYFDVKGYSPITLLELGLFKDKNIVVCCLDGYCRKGNVDIVCERFSIPQVNTLDELIDYIKSQYK